MDSPVRHCIERYRNTTLANSEIYDIFDMDGVLSTRFASYEFRDGQLAMAELVLSSYQEQAIAVIEAGTGIGKSFAYLVPSLLWSLEHPKERTVVATSTINLQKQLYEKDLVQLFSLLQRSCSVALVMGRSNYLCMHRLEEQANQTPLLGRDPLSDIGSLIAWSSETETGLKTDFPGKLDGALWADVCSDTDLCLGYRCSYAHECFFMRSRKKASESSILIANHHLLFTDARSRLIDELSYDEDAVLPPFQHLVIDEAHNIEKNATDFFTITFSSYDVMRSVNRISQKRRGGQDLIEQLSVYMNRPSLADDIVSQLTLFSESVTYLDTYLGSLMQRTGKRTVLVTTEAQQRLVDGTRLADTVCAHAQRLGELVRQVTDCDAVPDELDYRVKELSVHVRRILSAVEALKQFFDFSHWTPDVHWMEQPEGKSVAIHISPLSVAESLRATIFSGPKTVICTSATLDLSDEFAYWGSRVGLPLQTGRPYHTAVHHSPFDFRNNLLLLTPSDAPVFSERDPQTYFAYCINTIRDAVFASSGGALVLFTSYSMLRHVAQVLADDLEKAGITMLRQGEADRSYLLNRFIEDEDSVLFATDSFWEGVDAPGNTLRLVVIVKLPFRLPTDPVFRARQEALDREGMSGFFQLALPEATMKLKQGYGRLLRTTLDTGIVLILDSRVVQKQYGQWMLRALPESYHPQTTSEGVVAKIESFLYR